MNKKEFLKSINNIDDKFLREGEEFFAPEEAEKSLLVYRKKGITLKPVVSAAACCALVIAAAVFIGSLYGNKPVSYSPNSAGTADPENTGETETADETENGVDIDLGTSVSEYHKEIVDNINKCKEELEGIIVHESNNIVSSCRFDHIGYGSVKEQADKAFQRFALNITEPTEVNINPVYTTHDGEPATVRFFVLKDGEPTKFSALDSTDVTFIDTVFEPNSEIEVPISFTADQNDRIISIVSLFNPDDDTKRENDSMSINFINMAFNSEISQFVQSYDGSEGKCRIYQNDEGVFIEADFPSDWADDPESKSEQMIGFTLYLNGQLLLPDFVGDYTAIKMIQPSNVDENGSFVIQISSEILKPGDVIHGAVLFSNDGKIAFSFKETVK